MADPEKISEIVDRVLAETIKAEEDKTVPEGFRSLFTPLSINRHDPLSALFGNAEARMLAGCNVCGALVWPSALDRHRNFHKQIRELREGKE